MVETIVTMMLLAVPCWVVAYRRPDLVPLLLFAWVVLTGVFFARMGFSGPSKLLKDVLFVLPLYASVFAVRPHLLRGLAVTSTMLICFALFAGLAVIQIANPGLQSPLVGLLGLKVWLLYVPLALAVGGALQDEAALQRFLRGALLVCLVCFGTALAQVASSLTIGYETTIRFTHGPAAAGATQNFANFGMGGFFGRIPATFASAAEFYGFCGLAIALCYAALRFERHRLWRGLALAGLLIGCLAYVTSGSRGALAFIPLILLTTMVLERRIGAGLAVGILLVPAAFLGTVWIGIDFFGLAGVTAELARVYSLNVGFGDMWRLMVEAPLGQGTGSGTLATRHVMADGGFGTRKFFEGMYNKAALEFGILGPALLFAFLMSVVAAGLRALAACRDPRHAGAAAALLAWIMVNVAWSLKGWILDLDPTNVIFWMFTAIVLRLPSLQGATEPLRREPTQHPFLAQLRTQPTILGGPRPRS